MRRVKLCRTETQQSVDAASWLRGLRAKRAQRGHLPSKRREIIQAEEVSGDETRDTNDGSCAGGRTGCGVDGDRRLVADLDLAGNAHRHHKHSDGCFRRRKNHRRAVRIRCLRVPTKRMFCFGTDEPTLSCEFPRTAGSSG
jgi:hypothetical protein